MDHANNTTTLSRTGASLGKYFHKHDKILLTQLKRVFAHQETVLNHQQLKALIKLAPVLRGVHSHPGLLSTLKLEQTANLRRTK